MRHPSRRQWETKLQTILDQVDRQLEDRFGNRFPLHPARAKRGATSRSGHDGLFALSAKFSAGFGTTYGAGYIVDVRVATLKRVPTALRREIENIAADTIRALLPGTFPGRQLSIDRDGTMYKIHGDLSLGEA